MAEDHDLDRIARKAHEIWESEGRPSGRDQAHWDAAKEIVALEDSMGETLLPRDSGAAEPEEPAIAVTNQGEMPNLADQGRDDLTDTDREPEVTKPRRASRATHAVGDSTGGTGVSGQEYTPSTGGRAEDADEDGVEPGPRVAAVTPTPSNPMLGEPAPRSQKAASAAVVTPKGDAPRGGSGKAKPAAPDPTVMAPVGHDAATSGTAATPPKRAKEAPKSGKDAKADKGKTDKGKKGKSGKH